MKYLFYVACSSIPLLIGYYVYYYFRYNELKIWRFPFSIATYHIFASVYLIGAIVASIVNRSPSTVIFFLIFAVAGVMGEAVFSEWWHSIYSRRFWTYKVGTMLDAKTSLLNFLPWGAGGILYISVVSDSHLILPEGLLFVFSASLLFGTIFQVLFFRLYFRRRDSRFKFNTVTLENYIFFCLPIIFAVFFSWHFYGRAVVYAAVLFGATAATLEYLFGKLTKLFITKKLWTYNYHALDNGHFTPLSLIPFALAGFYFWIVAQIVSQIFPFLDVVL